MMKRAGAIAKAVVAEVLPMSESDRCSELLCGPTEGLSDHMENRENSMSNDESIVAALDAEYQEAVKNNDVATMDRILADDFALVTGNGRVYTKVDLLKEAAGKSVIYERQEGYNRTVRVWGDTAVVTALLWAKGTDRGEPFNYKVWFSDTYVRSPTGWRYVLGQSSLRLPAETE
jgi:ketosteroid isomerase-like protein